MGLPDLASRRVEFLWPWLWKIGTNLVQFILYSLHSFLVDDLHNQLYRQQKNKEGMLKEKVDNYKKQVMKIT